MAGFLDVAIATQLLSLASDDGTLHTRERRNGDLGTAPVTKRGETLDGFLEEYSATVAEAARGKVAKGEAVPRLGVDVDDIGEVERNLGEKLRAGRRHDDAASARSRGSSVASSLRGLLRPRSRSADPRVREVEDGGGVVADPEMVKRAKEEAAKRPSALDRVWQEIRYNKDSPVKILLDNVS